MTNVVSSRAKRPKNAWSIFSTKVVDTFELSLGYKNTKGDYGPYSTSPQTQEVKRPWGPPTECEYRKSEAVGTKSAKISKKALVDNNEKIELEDNDGLEKNFQSSYLGVTWIHLDAISVSKELNIKPNVFRVCSIMESMKVKYDPTLTVVVVAPEDDSEEVDMENLIDRKFVVVQKVHTLQAFKNLDQKGEFIQLKGHSKREVLCYVVNTRNLALLRYGYNRNNDISHQFSKKTCVQDLLHVFETLSARDSSVNCMKVIERMCKIGRVGPNEATSLRKVCKWTSQAFKCLMEVLKVYEVYETLDVKKTGNAGRISRGEKLCIPNTVFNDLAKVDETFFQENFQQIISKEKSLRSLVNDCLLLNEVKKSYGVLCQILGYQNIDALMREYPEKFDANIMDKFIGAEVKEDKKNLKAILLENYYNDVTKLGLGSEDIPVKFVEVECLEDSVVEGAADNADAVIFHFKEANSDLCVSIIEKVIHSEKMVHIGIIVFQTELLCFKALSYLRSQNTSLIKNFEILPVFFYSETAPILNEIHENLKHGIIFGKFSILKAPIKVYYSNIVMIRDVLDSILPPQSKVALITEPGGLPVVQVHTEQLLFKTVYYGSKEELAKFKQALSKDKLLFSSQDQGVSYSSQDSSDQHKDVYSFNDESSTSPFKAGNSPGVLNDSGFVTPLTSKVARKITSFKGFSSFSGKLDSVASELD